MDNNRCNKCGLLSQHPVQPKLPKCGPKKCCRPKDPCENDFVFRKVVIPAALGNAKTGKAVPTNGAYTNSYVEYEDGGEQYMYDSYGIYTKVGQGAKYFDDLLERATYAGQQMSGSTNIPDVYKVVGEEATKRMLADQDLQGQIDALAASSDVTDVVGTYQELLDYNTSMLHDRDIIKVLQDESHNDEVTYYRWSSDSNSFTLIGEEGPYYTKSAVDELLGDKQNVLTAGDNIAIENDVISAKDTTYTAGENITIDEHDDNRISAKDTTYEFEDTEDGWKVTDSDGNEFEHTDKGGEGGATALYDYTTNIAVGGVPVGTEIESTDLLADIIKQMLVTVYYPTYVAPSASLSYSVNNYIKVGDTVSSRAATVSYNAGAINLQGVKQNNRGGPAVSYALASNGADTEYSSMSTTSGSFTVSALTRSTKGTITLTGTVMYDEGPQPKDSNGNDYQTPLPSGSVSATKTFTFIQPFYWGKTSGTSISDFTGLTESVTPKANKTVSYTTNNEHMVFVYDSAYGNLSSILDPNSFETISGWTKSTLTVDGFTYNVYIANSATTDTDAEFTFKF